MVGHPATDVVAGCLLPAEGITDTLRRGRPFIGSVIFLIACIVFLMPLVRTIKKQIRMKKS